MKNIILTITLVLISFGVKAQTVTVKSDSFYEFTHTLDISTDEAVNTKNYEFVKSGHGLAEFVFNEKTKLVSILFYNGVKDYAVIDSMSKYDNGEINYFVTWPKTGLSGYYSLSTERQRNVLWCGFYYPNNTMGVWSSVVKGLDMKE